MKIVDNRKALRFHELEEGAIFMDDDGIILMKIPDDQEVDCNAIELEYGRFYNYDPCDEIILLNAKLVIEN